MRAGFGNTGKGENGRQAQTDRACSAIDEDQELWVLSAVSQGDSLCSADGSAGCALLCVLSGTPGASTRRTLKTDRSTPRGSRPALPSQCLTPSTRALSRKRKGTRELCLKPTENAGEVSAIRACCQLEHTRAHRRKRTKHPLDAVLALWGRH